MTYQILLDPDLDLSAEQFASAWNADLDRRTQAAVQAAPAAAAAYDPTLAAMATLIVIPLLVNLASSALYDLIKAALLEAKVRRRTRIEILRQPDGSELLIITTEDEA